MHGVTAKAMSTTGEAHNSRNAEKRHYSLTRKFAVGAAIIIVLTAGFLVHLHKLATADQTDRIAEETSRYVIQALSNGLLKKAMPVFDLREMASGPRQAHPAYQDLDAAARSYLAGTPILKLKIYNTAGRVIYSTNPEELGSNASSNPRFQRALAGDIVTDRQYRSKFLAWSGPRENIWILADYLPMLTAYDQGPKIGVIEIYRDITALHESTKQLTITAATVISGAFLLLFILLVSMVWRAERKTQAEHDAKLSLARAIGEAEATAREKTQFLARISHELRTPLNAIIGFAEILGSEIKGPLGHPCYKEFVNDIGKSGHYLLNIINEVLDLVKAESGTMAVNAELTDVIAVTQSVSRMLAPEAAGLGNILTVETIGEIGAIETDAGKLRHILINIVNNGLKFTPEGGEVCIKIDQDPETRDLHIRVIDNGIGMRAEEIPIAQTPFGQVQNVFTRTHKGTGLGLPLSIRFTEVMGGTLVIESKPQVGTTVTITLPEKPLPAKKTADGWEAAFETGPGLRTPGKGAKGHAASDAA